MRTIINQLITNKTKILMLTAKSTMPTEAEVASNAYLENLAKQNNIVRVRINTLYSVANAMDAEIVALEGKYSTLISSAKRAKEDDQISLELEAVGIKHQIRRFEKIYSSLKEQINALENN